MTNFSLWLLAATWFLAQLAGCATQTPIEEAAVSRDAADRSQQTRRSRSSNCTLVGDTAHCAVD